jgi:outer membrane protein OmpA-like peptidoglycan-associated protein
MPLAHAMLLRLCMKTRLGILLGSLLLSSAAWADRAVTTGPDFVGAAPERHIDKSLVASPDAEKRIDPFAVVTFQLNQAALGDVGYSQVDTAASWLKKHPRHKLVLEGHTDALGLAPYNEDLATRRMVAVRHRLLQHGISPDRIMMITFGEREAMDLENPLYAADRRVVMYATELSPHAVAAVVRQNRPAIVATWSERGALMRLTQGLEQPERIVPSQTVRR